MLCDARELTTTVCVPAVAPDCAEAVKILLCDDCAVSADNGPSTSVSEFTDDAMATLRAYHWPGNLAELEQVIFKIVSTTEARVVTSQQLPMRLREPEHWPNLAEYLAGQQKQYLDMVLHVCQGNKVRAAKVLGIDVAKFE